MPWNRACYCFFWAKVKLWTFLSKRYPSNWGVPNSFKNARVQGQNCQNDSLGSHLGESIQPKSKWLLFERQTCRKQGQFVCTWNRVSLWQGRTNETLSHPAVIRWFTVALYSFLSKTTFPNWEPAHFWSGSSFWSPGLLPFLPFYPSGYFALFAPFAFRGSNSTFVSQGLNSIFTIFTPWGIISLFSPFSLQAPRLFLFGGVFLLILGNLC